MNLKAEKLKMQIKKSEAAQAELEFRIMELKEDIERVKNHIEIQKENREKLKLEIEELENK